MYKLAISCLTILCYSVAAAADQGSARYYCGTPPARSLLRLVRSSYEATVKRDFPSLQNVKVLLRITPVPEGKTSVQDASFLSNSAPVIAAGANGSLRDTASSAVPFRIRSMPCQRSYVIKSQIVHTHNGVTLRGPASQRVISVDGILASRT